MTGGFFVSIKDFNNNGDDKVPFGGSEHMNQILMSYDQSLSFLRKGLKRILKDTNEFFETLYRNELGSRGVARLQLTTVDKGEHPSEPEMPSSRRQTREAYLTALKVYKKRQLEVEEEIRQRRERMIVPLAKRNDELFAAIVENLLERPLVGWNGCEEIEPVATKLVDPLPVDQINTYHAMVQIRDRLAFLKERLHAQA